MRTDIGKDTEENTKMDMKHNLRRAVDVVHTSTTDRVNFNGRGEASRKARVANIGSGAFCQSTYIICKNSNCS